MSAIGGYNEYGDPIILPREDGPDPSRSSGNQQQNVGESRTAHFHDAAQRSFGYVGEHTVSGTASPAARDQWTGLQHGDADPRNPWKGQRDDPETD